MNLKLFFYLLIVCTLSLSACGPSQAQIATQTVVAQTAVAASWTATPTLTPTQTLTPTLTPTETATPAPTVDLCLPENLPEALREINNLQIRFDNLSGDAANAQKEDLPDKITELQSILQTVEDQSVPSCLAALRDHQVKHMVLVIDTLNAFLDGVDKQTLDDMIKRARNEHDKFRLEYKRLHGLTPTP